MTELCNESLSQETEQHRRCSTSSHLMSRSMIRQVVTQNDLFLFTIETDHKVAFGIIHKRFTLTSWPDGDELFSTHQRCCPNFTLEETWAPSEQTSNILFQSLN